MTPPPTVPWEKLLWRPQPFPDNHVPASFLSELDHLPPKPRPHLRSLLFAALPISQHLAIIALFIAVFYGLLVDELGPGEVGWTCAACGWMGYGVRRWGWGSGEDSSDPESLLPPLTPLRSLILPPLLLALLSPILGTLTSATTSDSIWPLAGGLFFVHLLLADFTTGRDARLRRRELIRRQRARRGSTSGKEEAVEEKSLTSSLSLTSALSASIVLASRLPSTSHVFSLVLLAVGLFAGWPNLAKGIRESGKVFSLLLTLSLIVLALSLFPTAHPAPTLIFLCLILLTNVIGPLVFWYGWRWKTLRGGDWEVAVVKIRKREG
ncbi:phosphatidylinositol N-acetylglucosaminyltransferase subunit C, partial [Tremellales sp. Uapishka_1]